MQISIHISTETLIAIVILLGLEYIGYLIAFKPKKITTYYFGNVSKYPSEIKNKVNKLYGLTTMAVGVVSLIAVFIPEYALELICFEIVGALFVVIYGQHSIIKKYEESQKSNDETELK